MAYSVVAPTDAYTSAGILPVKPNGVAEVTNLATTWYGVLVL